MKTYLSGIAATAACAHAGRRRRAGRTKLPGVSRAGHWARAFRRCCRQLPKRTNTCAPRCPHWRRRRWWAWATSCATRLWPLRSPRPGRRGRVGCACGCRSSRWPTTSRRRWRAISSRRTAFPSGPACPRRHWPSGAEIDGAGARLVTADGFGCTSCHAIGSWAPQKVEPGAEGAQLAGIGQRVRQRVVRSLGAQPGAHRAVDGNAGHRQAGARRARWEPRPADRGDLARAGASRLHAAGTRRACASCGGRTCRVSTSRQPCLPT